MPFSVVVAFRRALFRDRWLLLYDGKLDPPRWPKARNGSCCYCCYVVTVVVVVVVGAAAVVAAP